MEVLGRKLEKELPDEARVIACRFPFPDWTPTATEGEGLDQTWAYDMNAIWKLSTQATMKWKSIFPCVKNLSVLCFSTAWKVPVTFRRHMHAWYAQYKA